MFTNIKISWHRNIMEFTWLLILIFSSRLVFGLQLPTVLNKCKFTDQKCIALQINTIIKYFGKSGIPEFDMPPLHTFELPDTQFVEVDPHKPLSYQVKITNATVYGFENTTITKVRTDLKQKSIEIYGRIPSLVGKTKSSVKARIIAGFFDASGKAIAELQNFRFILRIYFVVGNRGYLKVYKVFVNTKIDRAIFDVTDVHTHNSDFAIVVNQWMNENWQEIWSEFEPIIKMGMSEYFIEYVNKKLSTLRARYDDFFLPEDD